MQIPHLQILGKTEDWSYTRKISHKSCDSVIVRSRMTAPLIRICFIDLYAIKPMRDDLDTGIYSFEDLLKLNPIQASIQGGCFESGIQVELKTVQ